MSRKKASIPWAAASWRSRTYAPRVDKIVGPVAGLAEHDIGKVIHDRGVRAYIEDHTCGGCGHHACSCKPLRDMPAREVYELPMTGRGKMAIYEELVRAGMWKS